MKIPNHSLTSRRHFLQTTAMGTIAYGLTGTFSQYAPEKTFNYFNRRISEEAHQKMGELGKNGITIFAFTPSNGWVMVTEEGHLFARNIPDECYKQLGVCIKNGARIHCIAFPPAGGNRWIITTNKGIFARNIPEECYQKILEFQNAGHHILHVAFPPSGGNSWVVVSTESFFARNIDDECYQMMRNLTQGGRKITRVSFTWQNNGWAVIAQDEFFARRIDEESIQKIRSFASNNWELHNLAFSPKNNGWSIYSRGKNPSLPYDRVRAFENSLTNGANGSASIWTRMKTHKTPGCAVAVILNNQIAWSTGYGFLEKGDQLGATHPESRFQAASISKPVAAVGIMRLLEDTAGLDLNSDIRQRLNWTLPNRRCLNPTNSPTVNLLLQHRSGMIGRGTTYPLNQCSKFSNGGGGFSGYPLGQTIPSLLDIMNGNNTNSPAFELTTGPGNTFAYSGQGFVLLQRMIEEVSGLKFAPYMRQRIFQPLGMNNSTYGLSVPRDWIDDRQIAAGHQINGNVIPGKRNIYPESAAAGLYTSVEDLALLLRYLNRRWANATTQGPLNLASVQTLLSGRGFFVNGNKTADSFNYVHNGSNYGFQCEFRGYPNIGAGYAVMTNSDSDNLLNEVITSLRAVYGWA